MKELQHPASPQSVRAVFNPPPVWLKIVVTEVADDDPVLMVLDEGEKAALTLGVNLGADLILIDERKGAAAAKIKGLEFTGTLGILIRAAQRQWIDLGEAFARLRQTNFYCSDDLIRSLLARYDNQ
jgi:predicted nucleic acid-binding protein